MRYLKAKYLLEPSKDCLVLVTIACHFEDTLCWTELLEDNANVFDDAFTLDNTEYPATWAIHLPLENVEATRKAFEEPSKARFDRVLKLFEKAL